MQHPMEYQQSFNFGLSFYHAGYHHPHHHHPWNFPDSPNQPTRFYLHKPTIIPSEEMCPTSPTSTTSSMCASPTTTPIKMRPFKALCKHPLPEYQSFHSYAAYQAFRESMLSKIQSSGVVNKNMRRNHNANENKCDDPGYLEKRKKNNDAARRSRLARKVKEDEIAIRCAFLEQENKELKLRLAALESETNVLHSLVRY